VPGSTARLVALKGQRAGPPPSPAFESRPFVASIAFEYCLSPSTGDCDDANAILANGNGGHHTAILMIPSG
jgi:hypothetical protein